MSAGWIKLHRSLVDWEWYSDSNTFRVFMHLLLCANYEDKQWQGKTIERGQIVIGVEKFGLEVNLRKQQTRRALDNLQSTGEITLKPTNKYTIVTIEKYDFFQKRDDDATHKTTHKEHSGQHSNNTQADTQTTTTKEVKNKEVLGETGAPAKKSTRKQFIPPTQEQVRDYMIEINFTEQADFESRRFVNYHAQSDWRLKNGKMANWKAAVRTWAGNKMAWEKVK